VKHIATDVAVMYLGRIVETGPKAAVYDRPRHPYSQALLAAAPRPDPALRGAARTILEGDPPSPLNPPSGCAFHPRCDFATEQCRAERPELRQVDGVDVACHLAESVSRLAKTPPQAADTATARRLALLAAAKIKQSPNAA
jgi:oligopeptide/dipeptide ABC transporter ATP-binding protein